MEEKNTITINQPVDKEIYKKIKMIAVCEDRQIKDVVADALTLYANQKMKN